MKTFCEPAYDIQKIRTDEADIKVHYLNKGRLAWQARCRGFHVFGVKKKEAAQESSRLYKENS
jgi:hypothetical protein